MTRLATTPDEFRGTSRTTAGDDELVAVWRIYLRDAGWPNAVDLDTAGVRAAVDEVQRQALRLGRDPLGHLLALAGDRHARMHAPECATCGATRPLSPLLRERWGVLDADAACGDCLTRAAACSNGAPA